MLLAAAVSSSMTLTVAPLPAQRKEPPPTTIRFFGRVESVDVERKSLTVKHGEIAGYAGAGKTEHTVDDLATLKRLLPGDDIRATVHPNDPVLHQVQVVYRRAPSTPNRPGK